jgi:hypothetical protein
LGIFWQRARNELLINVYSAAHRGLYIKRKFTMHLGAGIQKEIIDDKNARMGFQRFR